MTDGTTSPPTKVVDLDDIAGWIEADRRFTAVIEHRKAEYERQMSELIKARDDVREQIQRRMGDATEACVGGRPVIRWAPKKPGRHLDQQGLKRDHPKIYAEYMVPSQAARPYVLLNPEADDRG